MAKPGDLWAYEVRRQTPTTKRARLRGSWGIYLRAYDVRLATFMDNSAGLRAALQQVFDSANRRALKKKRGK